MKTKLDHRELTFKRMPSGIPGTYCHLALWDHAASPVGIVWFRYTADDAIELLQSFVKVAYRRQGVRTAIHQAMRQWHSTPQHSEWQFMRTACGNRQSTPWLKKMGFKYRKDRNCWELKFQ